MKLLLIKIIILFTKTLNTIFLRITKVNILYFFNSINDENYKNIEINKKNIKFFSPNKDINWRADTLYTKEPETIDFINKFDSKSKKIIFWDIGSNIGLYSIYAAVVHKNIEVISFEPSVNNLRVLSRNISKNKLTNKIKLITNPLLDKPNLFSSMKENSTKEGSALNTFSKNFDFEGKKFNSKMDYKIFGTTINYLVGNKILDIPHYIKIDVDGLEHLILRGASNVLKSKKIKKISVELNENFKTQYHEVFKIMKKYNFNLTYNAKANSILYYDKHGIHEKSKKFSKTFNFHFSKIKK